MKLVITDRKLTKIERQMLAEQLNSELTSINYDGMSTNEIRIQLSYEKSMGNTIVISADTRLLRFVNDKYFDIDDVYIYNDHDYKTIGDSTKRILREGHDLMKLYESGEFEF